MKFLRRFCLFCFCLCVLLCCTGGKLPAQTVPDNPGQAAQSSGAAVSTKQSGAQNAAGKEKLMRVLAAAEIPQELALRITENAGPAGGAVPGAFLSQLDGILTNDDPYLRILVDKQHPLPETYEPEDLIELQYKSYRAGITDVMMLRRKAEAALEAMAAGAKTAGLTLTVSSAYRSYQYQIGSFDRWTARLGLQEAERVSARPGRSQHQLGLVADFGSITNDFAESAAGKWVAANAARFGFSLSYPRGGETLTGYDWESWHYRYVGQDLAAFINEWFGGIQQYALRFIHEWEKTDSTKPN